MEWLTQMLQLLFAGFTIGSIYALIAVGFVIIYNVTGVLNFSQGEFAMLGALLCVTFTGMGWPMLAAAAASIGIVVFFGILFERGIIHPARNAAVSTLIMITIGTSIALRGFAILMWGTQPSSLPPFTAGQPVRIFGAVLQQQSLWALGISFLSFGALYLFFEKTYAGKAVTACVANRFAARLMGIQPEKMSMISFAVSGGLGALAGIIIAPISGASYNMGLMLGLKAFVAAVIGGLTNAPAAVIGAYFIGILEALTEGLWTSGYRDAISFAVLLLVLFLFPGGILAKSTGKRV